MKVTGTTKRALWPAMAALALAAPAGAAADTDLGTVAGIDHAARDGIAYVLDEATGTGLVKLTLDCPPGTWPGGGGAESAWFKRIEPADGSDADRTPDDLLKVWVDRRTFTSTVTGYAICIDQRPTYTLRSKDLTPDRAKTAKAPCPDGTSVIGGGGNSSGEHIVGSYPFDDGDRNSKPDDGWAFRTWAGDEHGTVRARAVCLDVRPEYRTDTGTLPVNGLSAPTETCPATHHLVGIERGRRRRRRRRTSPSSPPSTSRPGKAPTQTPCQTTGGGWRSATAPAASPPPGSR